MHDSQYKFQPLALISSTSNSFLSQKKTLHEYSLAKLHQICEENYKLISSLRFDNHVFEKKLPENGHLKVTKKKTTCYTDLYDWTICIPLSDSWVFHFDAVITLYRDVKMAEILTLNTGYNTIKTCNLYQTPREKININRLLYEWLEYVTDY